ncbi:hypothetical protein E0500_001730 [Streptomyces sp. KM273126]|uniref:hypothetical protein n=1 Tax=Streptomyces sp. KM273126 TaxID=2545247 RepID=UPI00103BB0B0|nr:hypothetical protein [Streptomyces sp. KM273126]MBA2806213.1 hypothetical protein [Streptomyces sp. KM273126]
MRELTATAADMALPADRSGLAAVRQALTGLVAFFAALWPALREFREAGQSVRTETEERARVAAREGELGFHARTSRLAAALVGAVHYFVKQPRG